MGGCVCEGECCGDCGWQAGSGGQGSETIAAERKAELEAAAKEAKSFIYDRDRSPPSRRLPFLTVL